MNLEKQLVVKELIQTFSLIKSNALLFVISAFLDAAFFFFSGLFTTPIRDSLVAHAVLLGNELSQLLAGGQGGLLYKLFSPEISPLTYKALSLMLLLFVVLYAIYVAFQGTSWWLSRTIAGRKDSYRDYFLGFAKINLVWFGLYAIYKVVDLIVGLRYVLVQKLSPGSPNLLGGFMTFLFALLVLTAFFSYATLKKKALFKTALSVSVPLIVLSASIFLALYFIHMQIISFNKDLGLLAGLILVIPSFTVIRIYATRVLTHVHART